jgi:hypothetical protein
MTTQPSGAAPGLTPEPEGAIRRGHAQRGRASMEPAIACFGSLLAEHPGHTVLVCELSGDYAAGQGEGRVRSPRRRWSSGWRASPTGAAGRTACAAWPSG